MKPFFLATFIALVFSSDLIAQGFNANNGRNHPEIRWQVAETEHFEIMYPERLAGIEAKVAAIAEESYAAMSKNLEVEFSKKIRIYLSDEDEINNGFAVPIGKGYTNIWVGTNDYAEIWTGNEKWLRKVVAHELGHIFHFKATWTNLGLWNFVVGNPFTRAWTEGLAQYQTEVWDSQRGDRWLRKAIFDSRPDFNDGQSAENGRLLYATGNSELRYFTEKYGDSTLVDLFKHRNSFLKFWEYHDFYNAFDDVLDGGYSSFKEEWRKHMNIYYNTVASQMERTDSLDAKSISLPGQFYYDMTVSADGKNIAVLSLQSLARPVRRLYLVQNDSTVNSEPIAEGAVNTDLSWSSDGQTLYYSRKVRGEHSSIVNDIHSLNPDTGNEKRLTYSRRARFPVEGFEKETLAYIVNDNGTGNLVELDMESGRETRITNIREMYNYLAIKNSSQKSWLVHRFDADGNRNLVLIHRETGKETILDDGSEDNRNAVLSPDGASIAYTSLRDEVPNVFVYNFEHGRETRLTNLFTGGEVYGWITENDSAKTEKLLIHASETKRRDSAWWIHADREPFYKPIELNQDYSTWRQKRPPNVIASSIEADESLVRDRYSYKSFRNLTHAASIALPYYAGPDDYGIFATTNWVEPLGKHTVAALGWLSLADPAENSFGSVNYLNNTLYPFLGFSVYKLPESARFYGDRFLVEEVTGGEMTALWPLDALDAPYQSGNLFGRLRHVLVRPYEQDRFDGTFVTPAPETGRQTDLRLGFQVKKQRPWRNNGLHPLDGSGLSASLTGSEKILGSDVRFLTADLNAFTILPAIGQQRIYLHGRLQAQWGEPLPQDFIGFSRYDNISLNLPGEVPFVLFNEAERVRGFRDFVPGGRVAFGSLEYRIPFLPSLNTEILGLASLGSTSLALFSDAGAVWDARFTDGMVGTETRWGAGAEVKNRISLFGVGFTHSLGIAQPTQELFSDADYDLYYRLRAVVPF